VNDLTKLNLTAETLPIVANELVRKVKDGEINPLDVSIQFKIMSDLQELVKKQITDEILTEAEKWDKQPFKYGYYPKVSHTTSYTFKDSRLDELKYAIKKREAMLKTLTEPVVDPQTGEEIQPAIAKITQFVKWEK